MRQAAPYLLVLDEAAFLAGRHDLCLRGLTPVKLRKAYRLHPQFRLLPSDSLRSVVLLGASAHPAVVGDSMCLLHL